MHCLILCLYWQFVMTKKSHTCEEGRAHVRISFWHLLMNFEKPKKSEFWRNKERKMLEMSSFYTCVHKTTIIWGTVLEIQSETECFVISGYFLPFCPPPPQQPRKPKFWKNEKSIWRCHHFKLVQQKTWSYDVCLVRYGVC